METIKDIFDFCEARARYGEPVVPNWVQVRGNLLFLDQCVPLGEIALNRFGDILPPDRRKSTVPEVRAIDARIYENIRREVVRILGLAGNAEDEWEALRGFLRSAGETTTERVLYLLKSKAEVDLPGKCGEHQLRNQEVFYGKREQTDAGVSA